MPTKLIEVALPLADINAAARREKSIRHGHPSTLHLWWARRPLAAARAVLFAQLVDDPSAHPDQFPTEAAQQRERERLFQILRELVQWENSTNETVLQQARAEIWRSTGGAPPAVYDPFCGGGTIPLEAQRLGLQTYGSDLNPVAVLITKALVEIPPQFRDRPPVHPSDGQLLARQPWRGAAGLAADIRYYGAWLRDEAERRIGHLYPKVSLPPELGEGEAPVIAWLWARTVASPNPAFRNVHVPLVRSFVLSTRKGHEAWVEPVVDVAKRTYCFKVQVGGAIPAEAKMGTKTKRGASFRCLISGQPIPEDYIKQEARAGRLGVRLLAVVGEGPRGRVYLPPNVEHERVASEIVGDGPVEIQQRLAYDPKNIWCTLYGIETFDQLFTPRQLMALTTFSDLIAECRERVWADAIAAGLPDDGQPLHEGGTGATAYADAIATYLALAVDKVVDRNSALCSWDATRDTIRNTFARQALPMVWDFAEANPFSDSTGNWVGAVSWVADAVQQAPVQQEQGVIRQADACEPGPYRNVSVSTDPPYYDNSGYADLSDFFYVWLRRSLRPVFPDLFATVLTPKANELVATPYRVNGDKGKAKAHFEQGLRQAFGHLRAQADPTYPVTVYYAFKQTETDESGEDGEEGLAVSTGWETMLEGLLYSGFTVVGTWPMRTELGNRPIANGSNALASSIVLVCRIRPDDAPTISRREFLRLLHQELPSRVRALQASNIAPVDLAQSAIGPGMEVFSRYRAVLEADGHPMRVRTALALINEVLDVVLAEQESEYDPATRWALKWFQQFAFNEGSFGEAEVLSKAQDVALARWDGRLLQARGGKVRLLTVGELDPEWNPPRDVTVWEAVHHLARTLQDRGEQAAAALLARLPMVSGPARDLAYRLYSLCDQRGWPSDAVTYNSLVTSWPELQRLAGGGAVGTQQASWWEEA